MSEVQTKKCGNCVPKFDCDKRGCLLNYWPTDEHFDLMCDEFERIASIASRPNTGIEIVGICKRAITQTEQHVPVITQRNDAITQRNDAITALTRVGIKLRQLPETPEIDEIIQIVHKATHRNN